MTDWMTGSLIAILPASRGARCPSSWGAAKRPRRTLQRDVNRASLSGPSFETRGFAPLLRMSNHLIAFPSKVASFGFVKALIEPQGEFCPRLLPARPAGRGHDRPPHVALDAPRAGRRSSSTYSASIASTTRPFDLRKATGDSAGHLAGGRRRQRYVRRTLFHLSQAGSADRHIDCALSWKSVV